MGVIDLEAQYAEVVKAVGEIVKPFGFRKRAQAFRLCPDNCGIVAFQRSQDNTAGSLKFTVNAGVVSRRLLDEWGRSIDKATVWDAHIRLRVGAFLPENPDKWWALRQAEDLEAVIEEVAGLVEMSVVPFVMGHLTDADIAALWRKGQCPGITEHSRLAYLAVLEAE